jgi:DNA-binding Xre family transcriptional regulator
MTAILPESINLSLLPSVPLAERSQLPAIPCIYFAINSLGNVQYIGRSVNLKQRWVAHHRTRKLKTVDGVRIAYLTIDSVELLPEIEKALIEWFTPPLNKESLLANAKSVKAQSETSISGKRTSMRNKIKAFLNTKGITAYKFRQDVGIAQRTAYDLYNNPDQIPSSTVLSKICDTYEIQPNEIIEWTKK